MGHYDDCRDAYVEKQKKLAYKRSRITAKGLSPYKLESEYHRYKDCKRLLNSMEQFQRVVDEYENSKELKWEDFGD